MSKMLYVLSIIALLLEGCATSVRETHPKVVSHKGKMKTIEFKTPVVFDAIVCTSKTALDSLVVKIKKVM